MSGWASRRGLGHAAAFDAGPEAVVEEVGDGLHHRFDDPDGQRGAPILRDGVSDEDRHDEVHDGIGAGFQRQEHGDLHNADATHSQ